MTMGSAQPALLLDCPGYHGRVNHDGTTSCGLFWNPQTDSLPSRVLKAERQVWRRKRVIQDRRTSFLSDGKLLVTDGGLETTLIFHDGIDLPHFAAFPLLDDERGRAALRRYYDAYAEAARRTGAGCILDTPTFRASPDWAAKVGYQTTQLPGVIANAVSLLRDIRGTWEQRGVRIVINGAIGPRGDGYSAAETMDGAAAEAYHLPQIQAYAAAGADVVTAQTMTHAGEAI